MEELETSEMKPTLSALRDEHMNIEQCPFHFNHRLETYNFYRTVHMYCFGLGLTVGKGWETQPQ